MVASSILVAVLLAAPSLAVPVSRSSEPLSARDVAAIEEAVEVAARDPFNLGRLFKKVSHTVGNIAKVAAPIASNFIREDVEPEFTARDIAILDSYRDLAARDPSFGSFFKKVTNVVSKARHTVSDVAKGAIPIISQFTREEPDLELTERDFAYFEELAARDPNFWGSFKRIVGKVAKVAKPAARIAAGILIRDDDMESVLELSERDLEVLEDLAARDPFKFGHLFKKITHTVGNVAKVAAPIVSNFIREEDMAELTTREELADILELSERDFEDLEEVNARDDAEIDEVLAREYDLAMLD